MFMHFHAYVPLFIFILILILLVLFYLFLSLPISFVSFAMAPKRKSTLSQIPLHSGASTSSDSTPSHVQFCDDKARKDFSENFSWRGIHLERQVILSNFSDIDLPTVIYSRGWESLCGIPVTYHSVIIHEFYSNMHGFDTSVPHFVTRVQGSHIVVTLDIVSEVLYVPRVAHPDFPGCDRQDCVQRWTLVSILWDTFFMGWPSKHLMLSLC